MAVSPRWYSFVLSNISMVASVMRISDELKSAVESLLEIPSDVDIKQLIKPAWIAILEASRANVADAFVS